MPTRLSQEEAFHRISDVFGCKWALAVLDALERGIHRPSQIERTLDGLTPKVMYERLHKLERYGLIKRVELGSESAPHTEYRLTDRGVQVIDALTAVRAIANQWADETIGEPAAR